MAERNRGVPTGLQLALMTQSGWHWHDTNSGIQGSSHDRHFSSLCFSLLSLSIPSPYLYVSSRMLDLNSHYTVSFLVLKFVHYMSHTLLERIHLPTLYRATVCLRLPCLRAAACLDIKIILEFKKQFSGNTHTQYYTLQPQ